MNKNTWIGIIVAIFVIAFAVWAYSAVNMYTKPLPDLTTASSTPITPTSTVQFVPPQPQHSHVPITTPQATKPATQYVPLPSILSQPSAHECVYSQVTSTSQSSGVVYLADDKMRSEFRTVGGVGILSVFDGHYVYVWKEGSTHGTQTKYTDIAQLSTLIPKDLTSGAVLGSSSNNAGWKCTPWIPDMTLLSAPQGVTF